MFFYLALILLKKSEDYIARYSQDQTLNLVSIYQRKIIDLHGNTETGIENMFKNIVKSRKQSRKLQRYSNSLEGIGMLQPEVRQKESLTSTAS